MNDTQTTMAFLALLAIVPVALVTVAGVPKWLRAIGWLSIATIASLGAKSYISGGLRIRTEGSGSPTPTPVIKESAAALVSPYAANPPSNSAVPKLSPDDTPTPSYPRAVASSSPTETTPDPNVFSQSPQTAPTPAKQAVAKNKLQPQNYDLGEVIATADWARLTQDGLEVAFHFTNKTQRPLWIIPATRREKGGVQASDDVKNRYQLRSTIGFSRGTDRLQKNILNPNDFLELRPNVPAPASFIFKRNRENVEGATQIRFFATLSVVEDLKTFKSDNRTVSATIDLE